MSSNGHSGNRASNGNRRNYKADADIGAAASQSLESIKCPGCCGGALVRKPLASQIRDAGGKLKDFAVCCNCQREFTFFWELAST